MKALHSQIITINIENIFEEAGKSFVGMTMTGWDGKTRQHGTSSGSADLGEKCPNWEIKTAPFTLFKIPQKCWNWLLN